MGCKKSREIKRKTAGGRGVERERMRERRRTSKQVERLSRRNWLFQMDKGSVHQTCFSLVQRIKIIMFMKAYQTKLSAFL